MATSNQSLPPADDGRSFWNRHVKSYDRSMLLLGRPVARMAQLAAGAVRGKSRVLEVGAGTGLVTLALAREAGEVVATDYAAEMVAVLEAKVRSQHLANVRCAQEDLYALPYADRSFDAVVAANVLHLVPNFDAALASLRRVLTTDGLLIVPTYCHAATALSRFLSRILRSAGFPSHRSFTPHSLRHALEMTDLNVQRAQTLSGPIPIRYIEGTFRA